MHYVVVGYTENDNLATEIGVTITGRYDNLEIDSLIQRNSLDAIFIASVVPETFSYTTTIAMRSGLPIIAFDIGAVGRRLRDCRRALLIPLTLANQPELINRTILEFVKSYQSTDRVGT